MPLSLSLALIVGRRYGMGKYVFLTVSQVKMHLAVIRLHIKPRRAILARVHARFARPM